jgi:zinc/manganese transport system substrate-binding protein
MKADLLVQNGLGLEGGLEKTLAQAKANGVKTFAAADHITVRKVGPGEGIPTGDPDQAIGAEDPSLDGSTHDEAGRTGVGRTDKHRSGP